MEMIDQLCRRTMRETVWWCWRSLPTDRQSTDELEERTRGYLESAIRDFRQDPERFKKELFPARGEHPV